MKKQLFTIYFLVLSLWGYTFARNNAETFFSAGAFVPVNLIPSISGKGLGFGGNVGIGYSHYLNKTWDINGSLEINVYSTQINISSFETSYAINNPAYPTGYDFLFNGSYSKYSEEEKGMYINVPILFRKHFKNAYCGFGAKLNIPLSGTYNNSIGSLTTSGYSEYTGAEHFNEAEYGFSTYTNYKGSGSLDTKIGTMLSGEIGFEWETYKNADVCSFVKTPGTKIYLGLFVDYSILKIQSKAADPSVVLYQPTNPNTFNSTSILNAYSDKLQYLNIGIKLQVAICN